MRTFAPKGNVYGPIIPRYVFKKNLSHGAKIMYSYLCNLAGNNDHCWPSNKTISDEIGSCENSVKNYMKELANEKLIEVRITQKKRDIYILIPENVECGLNIKLHSDSDVSINQIDKQESAVQSKANFGPSKSNLDHNQPIFDEQQPNFGPINNLNKENKEIKNTPPLPPMPTRPNGNSFVARYCRPPAAECVSSFPPDFESIWNLYPKKKAKGNAFAVWQALQKANALPDLAVIQDAIRHLKQSKSWQMEDGRFVPQLAKWLNGMGWLDQLSENERQEIARLEAHRKAKESEAEREREFMAKRKAWLDSIRPQFDEFAAKFNRIFNRAEAFRLWSSLHDAGKAPSAADVPDNNTSEIFVFLLDYRNKINAEEKAQKAKMQVPVPEKVRDERTWHNDKSIFAMFLDKKERSANPEVMQSRAA